MEWVPEFLLADGRGRGHHPAPADAHQRPAGRHRLNAAKLEALWANSTTAPVDALVRDVLGRALRDQKPPTVGLAAADLRTLPPPGVGPVAAALAESGIEAAVAAYDRLTRADPATVDLDDERFADAVWGAIELQRTDLVWPLLQLWITPRPQSPRAWTMTGWARKVDGRPEPAVEQLRRALDLDPDNHDAALILSSIQPA